MVVRVLVSEANCVEKVGARVLTVLDPLNVLDTAVMPVAVGAGGIRLEGGRAVP